jgi:integrase
MSHREPIRREPSGRYMVVIDTAATGERRRQTKRRFDTYREARTWLSLTRTEVAQQRFVQPVRTTLEQWVDQWVPVMRTRVRPSTADSYERNLRLHVLPTLGAKPLQAIKVADLTNMYARLLTSGRVGSSGTGDGLSARSVAYVATITRACLQAALEGDLLNRNPADRAKPPRAAAEMRPAIQAWTATELAAFLDRTAHQRHHVAWRLLAMSGLRRGECLGLAWEAVGLDAGTISVRRTLVDVVAGEPVWSDPKTDRGRRLVHLDADTIARLRTHKAAQASERLLVGEGYRDQGLVFAMPDGRPIHPERFSREFPQTVERSPLPRIRLHDLRHTWATLALHAGVHPKVVQERLGHSNIAITLDIYSHVIPAMQTDAADRVAALIIRGPK